MLLRALPLALALLALLPAASADVMVCLVNNLRARYGVPPLGVSSALQAVAYKQAADMARMGATTHSGGDGSDPISRLQGLGFSKMGENVAGGQTTAAWAVDSFFNSPGHRASMLDPGFTCFGSANVGDKWAQEFGGGVYCPAPSCGGWRRNRRRADEDLPEPFVAEFGPAAEADAKEDDSA
ncbi:CAP domain-containing protein [Hyaloraphidium curvatum]|nr:CAP domain-containing protein [Hyaloraphidium curvatum]